MKVLWLTNFLLPEHALALGRTPSPVGGWMPALADALTATGEVELAIATNVPPPCWKQQTINRKRYFSVPGPASVFNYDRLPRALIRSYQELVELFQPEVIHVHGTEYFQGLLTGRKHLLSPTVISLHGLLDCCHQHYWGGIPLKEILKTRTLRDWLKFDGLLEQKLRMARRARWEREIFTSNSAFIGRTQWDKAHTYRLNPTASYHHCSEILRSPFYEGRWSLNQVTKHTIYASSTSYPLKGFHVLLKAVTLLKREFPDVSLRVPSVELQGEQSGLNRIWGILRCSGYVNYLRRLIVEEKLERNVSCLGPLPAARVAEELQSAHVFALPSFIENSPNSLAEAMLIGTPSVVSFTGGVPSMLGNVDAALCTAPGDAALLADQISRIFREDALANRLSSCARAAAATRYDRNEIVGRMLEIYRAVAASKS